MLNYLLAIFGLATLTALWVVFQLWLQKHPPEQEDRCIGCGANCRRKTDETKNVPQPGVE